MAHALAATSISHQNVQFSQFLSKIKADDDDNRNILRRMGSVFLGYLKEREGLKANFKAIYHAIDIGKYIPQVSQFAQSGKVMNLRHLASTVKNGISASEIPGDLVDIVKTGAGALTNRSFVACKNLFAAVCKSTGPMADTIKLVTDKGIVGLSKEVLSTVALTSSVGLLLGTSVATAEGGMKIAELCSEKAASTSEIEKRECSKKIQYEILNRAKFGSYALLGGASTANLLGLASIANPVLLTFSTSALVFTFASHFYKQLNHVEV